MRILFVGDIFARPGRTIVHERLPELQREYDVELTVANGENAAGGFGITPQIAEELFESSASFSQPLTLILVALRKPACPDRSQCADKGPPKGG